MSETQTNGGFENSDAAEAGSALMVAEHAARHELAAAMALSCIDDNPSGIIPTEYKILVLPDDVPEKTPGGLLVPAYARDQRQGACQTGTVIDMSAEAFSFIEAKHTRLPAIGDRIAYTKYAGMIVHGRDKKVYKLMNDKDVAGILDFPFSARDYQF